MNNDLDDVNTLTFHLKQTQLAACVPTLTGVIL